MRKEAGELAALETRYWHGFNDLQLHMRAHAEERDVLLRRVRARATVLVWGCEVGTFPRCCAARRGPRCAPAPGARTCAKEAGHQLMQPRLASVVRDCRRRQCCNAQCAMPHLFARQLYGFVGSLVRASIDDTGS